MFCPKCSQSQISDEVRFCSRCGFPLEGVAELLAADGISSIARVEETKGIVPYLRGKGALAGAKIMFFSLFLIPVAFAIAFAVDGPAPLLLALIPFTVGLAQMLYAIIFGKKFAPQNGETPLPASQKESFRSIESNSHDTSELPPAPSAADQILIMPASGSANTAEVFAPPSVTEETTKLLKNGRTEKD
jgi:hypothetical protein